MTTLRSTLQATAFLGSDVPAPSGSVGQESNRQSEPLLRRKDDLHVAYWNVRTLQDIGVIKVSGEETCNHLYFSGVLDNIGRHGVEIALSVGANLFPSC